MKTHYHTFTYKGHYVEIHSPTSTVHTISIDKKYAVPGHKIDVYCTLTEAKRKAKEQINALNKD